MRVRDLAEVTVGAAIRQGAVTQGRRGEAVTGIVMMLMGENSRVVVDDVKARFAQIAETLPEGVTLETFYDRTDLVDRTIRTVAKNLLEGAALVIVVLFLLLGNLRGGADRGARHPALDALRVQPDGEARHLGQPDEPRRHRLRPDRRRLGGR